MTESIKIPSGFHPVPGYSSVLVSRKGEVYFKDTGHRTFGGVAGRYRRVSVKEDGVRKLCYVHDLVCRAFHGLPKQGQVVLHGNDDRLDCRASNLCWGTQSKNIKDTYSRGLRKPTGKVGCEHFEPNWLEW